MQVTSYLLCVSVTLCGVGSEQILAVFPFIGKSHFYVYESVLSELARRGHEVTVISQFPRSTPFQRYIDIDVRSIGGKEVSIGIDDNGVFSKNAREMFKGVLEGFEKVYKVKEVQDLLNSTKKFDLVMTELFISDVYVGLSHKYQAPLVEMLSSIVIPWASDRFAIPDNPSYIRVSLDKGCGPLSFFERLTNTLILVVAKTFYAYFMTSNDERVSKECLGNSTPPLKEMMKNTSLLLVNSHFSLNGARPFPPHVIEIGGVHIKPAKPLPKDIEQFINESEHGVVYFSMGSVTNASTMSPTTRIAFCNTFAKLKQRVLWKWELDEMPDKPDNVKIVKWMPQRDVLAHPNVRVFMSHGGALGTIEGVYNGVPMIGIPVFGDQYQNIRNLVRAGSAELLELSNVTDESVSWALNSLLNDPRYAVNAKRMSKLFRDRPVSAMDTAVYWLEYVMRHKGAQHLRTAAVHLPWYQYLLLDVIAAFIFGFVLLIYIIVFVLKFALRLVCGKRKEKVQQNSVYFIYFLCD